MDEGTYVGGRGLRMPLRAERRMRSSCGTTRAWTTSWH